MGKKKRGFLGIDITIVIFVGNNNSKPFKRVLTPLLLNAVHSQIGKNMPVLPLKFSAVFDAIFEQEKSITQLMKASGLAKYQYREVSEQFEAIYNLIDTKYAK